MLYCQVLSIQNVNKELVQRKATLIWIHSLSWARATHAQLWMAPTHQSQTLPSPATPKWCTLEVRRLLDKSKSSNIFHFLLFDREQKPAGAPSTRHVLFFFCLYGGVQTGHAKLQSTASFASRPCFSQQTTSKLYRSQGRPVRAARSRVPNPLPKTTCRPRPPPG